MNFDTFREYCLSFPGVEETQPFGPEVLVYKVGGKMFATCGFEEVSPKTGLPMLLVNLKCDPERSIDLRDHYEEITPGYHMNKRHWNTLNLLGHLPSSLLRGLIEHSYTLVVASLPKMIREKLADET